MLHLRNINKVRRIVKALPGAVLLPPSVDLSSVTNNPYLATGGLLMPKYEVDKPSSLDLTLYKGKLWLKNNPLTVAKGIDFLDKTFLLYDYSGKYGSLIQGADAGFDAAANGLLASGNPYGVLAGGLMKAGGLGVDVMRKFGYGTDNVSKTDALLGNKFTALLPPAMIHNIFTKKLDSLHYDPAVMERMAASYTGSNDKINKAKEIAGKETGFFSSTSGRNKLIGVANYEGDIIAGIDKEQQDRASIATNMSDINHINYSNKINNALNILYSANAKLGGKLKRVKKINFHKIGGEIEWSPTITIPEEKWEPVIVLLEGGTINNRQAILDLFKDYDLSNINIIDSESPRVEGNNIYANSDEDLVHELYHYTSKNKPDELYKDFYSDLNDDKITKLGGNLQFVSRTGDPSDFYAPSELVARLRAAKYKSDGLNYTKDFFKLLRKNENKYGYNMRDLLYMFNDENLEKLFNLKYKDGGTVRWNFDTWFNSIPKKYRANQYDYKLAFEVLPELDLRNHVKDPENNHLQSVSNKPDNSGRYPFLKLGKLEDNPELLGEFDWYNRKSKVKYSLEDLDFINSHTIEYDKDRYYYVPKKFKNGGKTEEQEASKVDETSLKNVIPEGALHAHKHNMENADNLTKKGIPVVDNDGIQQAEIERDEIILSLELTKTLENLYSQYNEDISLAKKDEIAIEAGKLLVHEILENTDDRTGLISKCENGGVIDGTK